MDESEAFLAALEKSAETGDPNYARFIGTHLGNLKLDPPSGGLGVGLPEDAVIELSCSRIENIRFSSDFGSNRFVVSAPLRASIVSTSLFSVQGTLFEEDVSIVFSKFTGEPSHEDAVKFSRSKICLRHF